eukprot:GHVR01014149.1.p1 GENE.GHVR01014149.1~~GHVR01014149.1.p1  ORF type:complete len:353 (+),score=101.26 GHVR01014149.1:40-1098(+)
MSFSPECLKGKVALVTGGGTGICRGITETLMSHGADTIIISRRLSILTLTANELCERTGGRCLPLSADVRDERAVSVAVKRGLEEYGRIDILVNGAAGNFLCGLDELSTNAFKSVVEIDTLGTFIVTQCVVRNAFKLQQQGGVVINISATIQLGTLFQTHAGVAKSGVDALTRHMSVEYGPSNVRVVGVAPGPIKSTQGFTRLSPTTHTSHKPQKRRDPNEKDGRRDATLDKTIVNKGDGSNKDGGGVNKDGGGVNKDGGGVNKDEGGVNKDGGSVSKDVDDALDMLSMYVPLQRVGCVSDVGSLCLFLCLPEASYITGTTIVVDGGQSLSVPNFTLLHPKIFRKWRADAKL